MCLGQVIGVCVPASETLRPLSWDMVESGGLGHGLPQFPATSLARPEEKVGWPVPFCSASQPLKPSGQRAQLSVPCLRGVDGQACVLSCCGDWSLVESYLRGVAGRERVGARWAMSVLLISGRGGRWAPLLLD